MQAISKLFHKRSRLAGLLLADIIIFGFTSASSVPSFMLMIGFVLLIATFYSLVHGILTAARLYGVSVKQKRRLAGSITGLVGFIVAMQSVGELNSRDVVVLLLLVVIGYTYSFYSKPGIDPES